MFPTKHKVFVSLVNFSYEKIKSTYNHIIFLTVIINNIFPAKIKCMVEDRDKHAIEVSHIGVDVLMLDKSYNKSLKDTDRIKRIYKYEEILEFVKNKE